MTFNPKIIVPKLGKLKRLADNRLRVSWSYTKEQWESADPPILSHDVLMSTSPLFPQSVNETYSINGISVVSAAEVGATRRDSETRISWSIDMKTVQGVPLCQTVVFVAVRATEDSNKLERKGGFSTPSPPWLNLDARDCEDNQEYLDCYTEFPQDWECKPCPPGAWCKGVVDKSQVKADAGLFDRLTWTKSPGHWRDNRSSDTTDMELYVPFEEKFVQCKTPWACSGSDQNETCNTTAGYLDMCCDDVSKNCGPCRLCQTCRLGFAMHEDGVTCGKCDDDDMAQNRIIAYSCLIFLVVVLVFGMLVFLKIKAAVKGESSHAKAAHSTVKRILLSHMQVIMLCASLNVPWPSMVRTLMSVFSSMSSLSNHVSALGCIYDVDLPVRKQARFLYRSTLVVMFIPVLFCFTMWLYWMVLVPTCCGRCLACGKKGKLQKSRACFCRKRKEEETDGSNGGGTDRGERSADASRLSTRDIWTFCVVLFCCKFGFCWKWLLLLLHTVYVILTK